MIAPRTRAALFLAALLASGGAALADEKPAGDGGFEALYRAGGQVELPGQAPPVVPAVRVGPCLENACRTLAATLDPESYPYPQGKAAVAQENARIAAALGGPTQGLPDADKRILAELRGLGASDVDIFHGSHLVLRDDGARYEEWRVLDAHPRVSSHYPQVSVQQFEVRFPGIGVLLFGRTEDGSTWCQMEAHGASVADAGFHVGDYLLHEATDANVGPMGLSPRTDARPIVLGAPPAAPAVP